MIRQAKYSDLKGISFVHSICFPESFITQLSRYNYIGGNLLPLFYKEFIDDNPELFVVAEDENNKIVGFCMGYYMDKDNQSQRFIKKNLFRISIITLLQLLACNKFVWRKFFSRIKHKPVEADWKVVNDKHTDLGSDQLGDLLSVCVLPDYRGRGYAQDLLDAFLHNMKNSGRKLCLLSVRKDNVIARKYYEKNGFELYRVRGAIGLTYMKLL